MSDQAVILSKWSPHLTFELCSFWYVAHSQILGNTLYLQFKAFFFAPKIQDCLSEEKYFIEVPKINLELVNKWV
jgi:hypothetical protein